MATQIITCTCQNDWQDKKYGKLKRVANRAVKHDKWRCTVCGQLKD